MDSFESLSRINDSSVIIMRGLTERQTMVFNNAIKILTNADLECEVMTIHSPRSKKTEQKTSYQIGDLEFKLKMTIYPPSGITHHELKIVYQRVIKFFLVYDSSKSHRCTEVLIDESGDIEIILKKLIHRQEELMARNTQI